MGIQSSMSTTRVETRHRVHLVVASDDGSAATVKVKVAWDDSELGSPSDIVPSGGVMTQGQVVWSDQTVDQAGTVFRVDLGCQEGFSGASRVEGEATETGGAPQTHREDVGC